MSSFRLSSRNRSTQNTNAALGKDGTHCAPVAAVPIRTVMKQNQGLEANLSD
jgi:hypothetical protein